MTKVKNAALALVSAVALTVPSLSMAQGTMDSMKKSMTGPDSGWLVGGSVGQSKLKFECPGAGISCDDTDTALRVFGGYNFNKNFGVELGYADLGKATFSGGGASESVKGTAWDVMAVGTLPIGDKFGVYGKLGMYRGEAKGGGDKETNTDVTYAIGGQYNFSKNLGLRVEWQQYKGLGGNDVDADVDVMSIGVVYYFR